MTDPLGVPRERLGEGTRIGVTILPDAAALAAAFAEALLAEYRAARAAGRRRVVFIVPVGPVGQYELLAERCRGEGVSLHDLLLIGMDEYLTPEGEWIAEADPLSFRGHVRRHLTERMAPGTAPEVVFPDPRDLGQVPRLIAAHGGVDVCFGGVGIAGHLAFNEPPEPGEEMSVEAFAALPTRIQALSRETRTINAVTATRGAIELIPRHAATVGMREILGARKLRLYLNRPWQTAILRRMLHGPVTAAVPASLVQRHGDVAVILTEEVARLPGAGLA